MSIKDDLFNCDDDSLDENIKFIDDRKVRKGRKKNVTYLDLCLAKKQMKHESSSHTKLI
jgi:hypothetical protein